MIVVSEEVNERMTLGKLAESMCCNYSVVNSLLEKKRKKGGVQKIRGGRSLFL